MNSVRFNDLIVMILRGVLFFGIISYVDDSIKFPFSLYFSIVFVLIYSFSFSFFDKAFLKNRYITNIAASTFISGVIVSVFACAIFGFSFSGVVIACAFNFLVGVFLSVFV